MTLTGGKKDIVKIEKVIFRFLFLTLPFFYIIFTGSLKRIG